MSDTIFTRLKYILVGLMGLSFLIMLFLSVSFGVKGDAVYLHYVTYLIDHLGWIPYKDIFTPNLPGTYLLHLGIGQVFGYTDNGLIIANLLCVTGLFIITYFLMKPYGVLSIWTGFLLFANMYLGAGPFVMLQRDFLAILLVAATLLLPGLKKRSVPISVIQLLTGFIFGWVGMIKPHLMIGIPLVITSHILQSQKSLSSWKTLWIPVLKGALYAFMGLLMFLMIPAIWLWQHGGLPEFLEILSSYLPLYIQMSDDLVFREGWSHLIHKLSSLWYIKLFSIFLICGALGVYFTLKSSATFERKKLAVILLAMACAYLFSVIVAGRIWANYLMPFLYFICLCVGLLLSIHEREFTQYRPLVLLMLLLTFLPVLRSKYNFFQYDYSNGKFNTPTYEPDASFEKSRKELEDYLKRNMQPYDRVHLDTFLGGPAEAMWSVKGVPANPYTFHLPFYHHVSTPYIKGLKTDLLVKLKEDMPEFVISTAPPQLKGKDTSGDFPQFRDFIERYYYEDYVGASGFIVYRKKENTILQTD